MRASMLFASVAGVGLFSLTNAFTQSAPTEAPPAFDSQMNLVSNGFVDQAQFDEDRDVFEEVDHRPDGLGPVYNATSCVECHQNPVTGGASQITELRAGHLGSNGTFVEHPGGSLINDRATRPEYQERVAGGNEVRAFRASLSILGDGFVEAIADDTLRNLAAAQPRSMRGQVIEVPVFENNNQPAVGRFGWKNQQASLVSFSADAYLNEIGVTSPLQPTENTSNGVVVDDGVADPEDDGEDIAIFARFMRATGVPPRDTVAANTPDAKAGNTLFNQIGCVGCHTPTIVTAPVGTSLHGGNFIVPAALGDKIIHPYSDFLLHNIGTGDGIVQNGGPSTRLKVRTPPLWGLRSRGRLMHDAATVNRNEAILLHRGEATSVINRYRNLSNNQKNQLIAFLNSL